MSFRLPAVALGRFLPPTVLALALSLDSRPAFAGCVDYATHFRGVASVLLSGSSLYPTGLATVGQYVLVANGAGFLDVVSVSTPAQPTLAAGISVTGLPLDVQVKAGIAYVLTQSPTAVASYNAGSLPGLLLLDSVTPPETPEALAVGGNLAAFVGSGMLRLYDISVPSSITARGTLPLGETIRDAELIGSLLYLAGSSELHVVDVSDPVAPALLGSTSTPGLKAVTVSGTTAYCTTSLVLYTVDVGDPSAPSVTSTTFYSTYGKASANDLAVDGTKVYVVHDNDGIWAWDIADPAAPVRVGGSWWNGERVIVAGDFVYTVGSDGMFRVVDATNPLSPALVETSAPLGASDLAISGTHAYSVNYFTGLTVVDIADPSAPAEAGFLAVTAAASVEVTGSIGLVGTDASGPSSLHVVDVSSPASPSLVTTVPTSSRVDRIVADGAFWYLLGGLDGVQIVDPADPSAPVFRGSLSFSPEAPRDLAVVGTIAYAAGSSTYLYIVDVSDPDNPVEIASIPRPWFGSFISIAATATHVFAASSTDLAVIDVADPATPYVVTTIPIPPVSNELAIVDDNLYLASDFGVGVVDVSDPANPVLLGGSLSRGTATVVRATRDHVYASGGFGTRFEIRPAQCGTGTGISVVPAASGLALSAPAPNPFRAVSSVSFTLPAPGEASLALYDVTGRHVRDLARGVLPAGRQTVTWDGRGADGRSVPGGVYFLRLRAGGEARSVRVVYLGR